MEILQKTLGQMRVSFSSNEFSKKARKNGLTDFEVANGVIATFLHRNAIQGETRRTWSKRINLTPNKSNSDKLMDAITLLKDNGYRVLKPVSEWQEV